MIKASESGRKIDDKYNGLMGLLEQNVRKESKLIYFKLFIYYFLFTEN